MPYKKLCRQSFHLSVRYLCWFTPGLPQEMLTTWKNSPLPPPRAINRVKIHKRFTLQRWEEEASLEHKDCSTCSHRGAAETVKLSERVIDTRMYCLGHSILKVVHKCFWFVVMPRWKKHLQGIKKANLAICPFIHKRKINSIAYHQLDNHQRSCNDSK